MKIKDIMTKNVEKLTAEASVRDAAKIMKDLNVGVVPVTDGNHLIGMITDRDIAIRLTAEGRDPNMTKVREIMTKDVIYCKENEDVKDAAKLMGKKQIRRLPVVDEQEHLIGIVSLGDISVDMGKDSLSGDTLEDVSKPSKPMR